MLYYAFAAFLPFMQRSLSYSQTTLAGAFSLNVLVTGQGPSRRAYGWTGAAYATVNAYFDTGRQNALLALIIVAGLASTIFVPASSLLIIHLGWRHALVVLAIAEGATIVPHFLIVRRRPADQGWQRDGAGRVGRDRPPGPVPGRLLESDCRGQQSYRSFAPCDTGPWPMSPRAAVLGSAAIAAVAIYRGGPTSEPDRTLRRFGRSAAVSGRGWAGPLRAFRFGRSPRVIVGGAGNRLAGWRWVMVIFVSGSPQ